MKRICRELAIQLAITTILFFTDKISKVISRTK